MIPRDKEQTYYGYVNGHLVQAVPPQARRVLDVGCADGQFGAALKRLSPGRQVFGVEVVPEAAVRARQRLDEVFTVNLEHEDLPIEAGSLDCITFGDVLEHLLDPEAVLERLRPLLRPEGIILASIPNLQHYSVIMELLRGDFQYTRLGLLDATHLRFFTFATIQKMFLDTGFVPQLIGATGQRCPEAFLDAAEPLLSHLGADLARSRKYLEAYQYIVRAARLEPDPLTLPRRQFPLSLVVPVHDQRLLRSNLLSSPCLGPGSPHEVIQTPSCRSAALALEEGLARARNPLVVLVQQDVYLPRWWDHQLLRQYALAEQRFGRTDVAGVSGIVRQGTRLVRAGRVIDRDNLVGALLPSPVPAETLDDAVLVFRKNTTLRLDPQLGFHCHGADVCLSARRKGLKAVALEAMCLYNKLIGTTGADFLASAEIIRKKWPDSLPVTLPSACLPATGPIEVRG